MEFQELKWTVSDMKMSGQCPDNNVQTQIGHCCSQGNKKNSNWSPEGEEKPGKKKKEQSLSYIWNNLSWYICRM